MKKARSSSLEADRIARERSDGQMLQYPGLWPCWPFLPVKRKSRNPLPDIGIVLDDGKSLTVYLVNLFALPKSPDEWAKAPRQDYLTHEGMLADGWRVD